MLPNVCTYPYKMGCDYLLTNMKYNSFVWSLPFVPVVSFT